MNHIFISYSRRYEKLVTFIVDCLREEGLSVWQDVSGKKSGIPYSTKWFDVIKRALYTASGAVIFRSVEWENSAPCRKEYELILKLKIPFIEIDLKKDAEVFRPEFRERDTDNIIKSIMEWSSSETCTGIANENRTWMFSSLSIQELWRNKNAGIPRFRKRKEALAFLENLRICENYINENDIRENEDIYKNAIKLIKRSRALTRFDMIVKPAVAAICTFLVIGIVIVNKVYENKRDKIKRNVEGLMEIEVFHDDIYVDEVRALLRMAVDEHDYGDCIYLLFENYADVLDTEFPVDFYKSGSDKADAVMSLPIRDTLNGYRFEPSKDTGVFTVCYDKTKDSKHEKKITLLLASVPDAYATDGEYLAMASAQQVYLFDLKRGHRIVELRYCYRDVESLRFDEMGRICALTKAGDVYVWENPIRKALKEDEIMPKNTENFNEYISTDGRFRITGSGDGMVKAFDIKNNCVIYTESVVTEPIKSIYMDEENWKIYIEGYSGAVYVLNAGNVLANYSYDVDEQLENYKRLGDVIIKQMMLELKIAREW